MRSAIHSVLILFAIFGSSCGIHLGNGVPNDTAPTSPLIASATFTAIGGASVTGSVGIHEIQPGDYILRLGGMVAPSENGQQLVVWADGTVITRLELRAVSGNQNYSVRPGYAPTVWNRVDLHSTARNTDYGVANFP